MYVYLTHTSQCTIQYTSPIASMCIYIYMYIHVYIYICVNMLHLSYRNIICILPVYIDRYQRCHQHKVCGLPRSMDAASYIYIYTYIYIHIYYILYIYIWCIYIHIKIYIYIHTYMYVYIYIFIFHVFHIFHVHGPDVHIRPWGCLAQEEERDQFRADHLPGAGSYGSCWGLWRTSPPKNGILNA